jgi:HEPN domain-containing protein
MLKGFLVANTINPPRTHDLPLLCDMCIKINDKFGELSDICEFLTLYGVQPRYPNELDIINEDANMALRYIDTVYDFFEKNGLIMTL